MLVILSLLALFTLLGLTLVLATSRAKLNALASARSNPQAMRDDAAIDEIVNQIFRGTNDPDSVLRFHSLLEDLYGSPILLGRVDGPPTANTLAPVSLANGQLVSMNVAAIPGNNLYNNIVPAGGEYTGLVITMLNGRAQGRSSRVVGHTYNPVTLTTTLQVIAFDGLVPSGPNAAIGYLGDQFLINGRPFSGTGFGFNAAAVPANAAGIPQPLLTAYDPAGPNPLLNPLGLPIWYYALLPNSAATGFDSASAGGANETYDVPDFQNMILALHYFDPTLGTTLPLVPVPPNMQGFGRVVLNPTKTASVGSKLTPLPSLHRPDLVNYWANQTVGGTQLPPTANPQFLERIILRPMWTINQATGLVQQIVLQEYLDSNGNGVFDVGEPWVDLNGNTVPDPATVAQSIATDFTSDRVAAQPNQGGFSPVFGPWDVDNDGDGSNDSIWVDAGLEVQTAPDGTKFKLLAAILCVDMDGKININANGTLAQLDTGRYGSAIAGPFAGGAGSAATGAVSARFLAMGQGAGPWEINPLYLFMRNQALNGGAAPTPQAQALADMLLLWQGCKNPSYDGVYGESQRPGLVVPDASVAGFGATTLQFILGGPQPGVSRWYDAGTNVPHDPFSLAAAMGVRPGLLQPQLSAGFPNPGNFFDYIPTPLSNPINPFSNVINPVAAPSLHVPTSYGSPYDLHARGVTGTDIAGHPFYAGTPALSWTAVQIDPATLLPLSDVPDHPGNLDLSQNAQHDGWYDPANNVYVTEDQPFGGDVLSHLLRPNDSDMVNSPSRLKHLADLSKLVPGSSAPAWPLQDTQRWAVTTVSTHLPVSETAAPDFTALATGQDIFSFSNSNPAFPQGPALFYNNKSIVDLVRARIYAENSLNPAYQQINSADIALFGNAIPPVWPLLAPELVQGLKLDINRLLGNGFDDNLNGVVDDPFESLAGEQLVDPRAQYLGPNGALGYVVQALVDHNNDGLYPGFSGGTDLTNADFRARQLLAKQLYVLMMLLVDDRTLKANIFPTSTLGVPTPMTPPLLPPWPQYDLIPASTKEQAAYVIAQWAINAVDFRDADSIMTPFEFDLHPFQDDDLNPANGTWDVDDVVYPASGVVFPPNPVATPADDLNAWRGLVFGAERPALLLTEMVAVHDRGTDDTNLATNQVVRPGVAMAGPDTYTNDPTNPDPDFDQVRRPRGSVVVELFNPNGQMDAPRNDLLYDARLGAAQPWTAPFNATGVNLGQAVVDPITGKLSSVWRLAVVYSPSGYDAYAGGPAAVVVDPRVPALPAAAIHRVAYLGAGVTAANDYVANSLLDVPVNRSFYVDSTITGGQPLIVPPDSYAIVGPGTVDPNTAVTGMYMGARNKTGDSITHAGGGKKNQYPLHVDMWIGGPFTAGVYNSIAGGAGVGVGPYLNQANYIKPVVGVPLATNLFTAPATTATAAQILPQNGRATAVWTQRFSLSEPESGYPVWPTFMKAQDDEFFYQDVPAAGSKWPNIPWDSPSAVAFQATNAGQSAPNPNVAPNGSTVGTVAGYTTVYLQRLANPLAVWDPYANPYITVDGMDVNLTSYTGEASPPSGGATGGVEKPYPGVVGAANVVAFDNLRRGEIPASGPLFVQPTAANTPDFPNIWRPLPHTASGQLPRPDSTTSSLAVPLPYQTLGYLNLEYCPGGWAAVGAGMYSTTNVPPTGGVVFPANYYGDPMTPFPWFPWNDRPYVSQYELMLVPASGPSSLLTDMGLIGQNTINPGNAFNQYRPTAQAAMGSLPFAQLRHYLNFFDDAMPGNATITNEIPRLYRVFDYINVPSRFAGTQDMLDPNQFAGITAGLHTFHPPFNWLSQYREPGRVNLNTIFDPQVFQGVMDDYPGAWNGAGTDLWSNLIVSRRGYGGGPAPMFQLNPFSPTVFANPFRAAGTSTLVPLASMMPVDNTAAPTLLQDVNGTLLRANGSLPGGATPGVIAGGPFAIFDANTFDPYNQGATESTTTATTTPYRQAGRNPNFEYAPETRLGNLTTNHSNVYAIWITLGKFKVQQGPVTAANPDGYYLVPNGELIDGTVDVDRPKAFYIYDRSIPVGFIRGENLNVEKGTLVGGVLKN